jgi:hypothetical protein
MVQHQGKKWKNFFFEAATPNNLNLLLFSSGWCRGVRNVTNSLHVLFV